MGTPIEEAAKSAVQQASPQDILNKEDPQNMSKALPDKLSPSEFIKNQDGAFAGRQDAIDYFGRDELDSVSPVTILLKAQARFIKAQAQYIHVQDLARMATAQEIYIADLTQFLESTGIL
jgi:hypothetical protein